MRAKDCLIAGIAYGVITVLLLWPVVLEISSTVIDAGDPLFYAWNLSHNWHAFTHGFTNLLNTNIFYPTTNTLAFSDTLFAQTLLVSPILWLTGNPILAQNLYVLLTFPIAGLSMLLLSYHVTQHKEASFVAGLFYAFSLPRLGQITHMPAISSQWLPLLILSLLAYLKEGRRRDLLWFALWFTLLTASSVYFFVFAVVTAGIIFIAYGNIQRIIKAIPVGLLLVVILIPLNYPYIRLKAEQPQIKRNIEEAAVFAAYQQDYYSVLPVTRLLSSMLPTTQGERALFPTFTVIAFALGSLLFLKKWKKEIVIVSLVGITAFVLSFGPSRPFHLGSLDTGYLPLPYTVLYRIFPLLQIIRVPARFSILVILALSLLAALPFALHKTFKQKRWLPFVAGLIFLTEIWQAPMALVRIPSYDRLPAVYQFIKQQRDIRALVELPIGKIEEGKTPITDQVKKQYQALTQDDPLATEAYRVYFAGYHLKPTANGYSGFVATSFHDTVDAMREFPSEASLAFLKRRNISHVIVHLWQYPKEAQQDIMMKIGEVAEIRQIARLNDDIVYEIVH